MAFDDAYATLAEYQARTNKNSSADSATVEALLDAVSRFFDSRCRRRDGFNLSDAVEARVYDAAVDNEGRLWLPDDVATATGLVVKVDLNADYDYADTDEQLTIDVDFWIGPYNAAKGTEKRPYEWLRVHPNSTKLSAWPEQERAVEVTAKYGWPAVPGAIKEAVVAVTRSLVDLQVSGGALTLQDIEQAVTIDPKLSFLVKDIERQYKRPTALGGF